MTDMADDNAQTEDPMEFLDTQDSTAYLVPGPEGVEVLRNPARSKYGPIGAAITVTRPQGRMHTYCVAVEQEGYNGSYRTELSPSGVLSIVGPHEQLMMMYAPGSWTTMQPKDATTES